jgi:predicted Zn-dependent peptidase
VISYDSFTLSNGLRVIHHYDSDATVVILNILYNVGARDENPNRTGFAHLFEHLMFSGSENIAEYDKQVEQAGGNNNAFTNNDYTNYYITVPAENVETAFWLESDRMLKLAFSQKSLDIQKGVVVEEFKQRCYNAPFGMLWHHLRSLLYKEHPYQWPTIGLSFDHVETATLADVESFYYRFYHPANAILCVGGKISLEETKRLCEKWFGSINRNGEINKNIYPKEPKQTERRFMEARDLSPDNAVFMAWRGPAHLDPQSVQLELFAEMMGGSETSPLYLQLVKKTGVFNAAESFYMRSNDDGIFVLYGVLNENTSHEQGEKMLMDVFAQCLNGRLINPRQLEMVKNQTRTQLLFEKATLMNTAQKLCFFENLAHASLIDEEEKSYLHPSFDEIIATTAATIAPLNASVLYYSPLNA